VSVAVVGSGFSAIAVAHALVQRNIPVTILDVGETLDERRQDVVTKLHNLPTAAWTREDLAVIRENSTIREGALPKKVFFGSDRIYANDRPFAPITTMVEGRAPYPTFMKGGFSNIWGAAALPVDACDMTDWPISRAELDPYFDRVSQIIPLCGGAGTLSKSFPSYKDVLGAVDPGPQGKLLLEDMSRAEARLTRQQTLYGSARLTIHTTEQRGDVLPCNGCGHCFAGCVRGSIYSTLPQLDELVQKWGVVYKSGIFVESVDESIDKATIRAMDVATNQRIEFSFDAVFLGAGPINTTRLLLASRRLYDQTVVLKESQKFVLPLVRFRGADTAVDHPSVTVASVFFETKVPQLSEHWLHAQIVPFNQLVLDGAPIPGKSNPFGRALWSPVFRRLMAAWCSMHSDHSSRVELTLRQDGSAGDRLELNLVRTPEAKAAARTAAIALLKRGLQFKTIFLPPLIKPANPGSGTHCGGSFPMRSEPRTLLDTDALGRPFGWSRVFAVDSSVLPSIPGTTLAFTVMANAYRIGSLAPAR
jgi:choline dehydrogenase-like flavoprotein